MNNVVLVGRLTRDPESKAVNESGRMITWFTIAVQRDFVNRDGEIVTDFIPVAMWGKQAEAAFRYLHIGSMISVKGKIRTGSFVDKDGNKRYKVEVEADDFHFISSKRAAESRI